jgi:hypothetical protein
VLGLGGKGGLKLLLGEAILKKPFELGVVELGLLL